MDTVFGGRGFSEWSPNNPSSQFFKWLVNLRLDWSSQRPLVANLRKHLQIFFFIVWWN